MSCGTTATSRRCCATSISSQPMAWARRVPGDTADTARSSRRRSAQQFPDLDPAALAFACRNRLALVQVPPRGMWGRSHQVTVATVEAWLGRPLNRGVDVGDVGTPLSRRVRPGASGRHGDVVAPDRPAPRCSTQLRPDLVDVRRRRAGRELFDLPDAPRPDPATPAPVRFLPEYDNVLLSHADRSRFFDRDVGALYPPGRLGRGHVLVDGTVRATWIVTDARLEVLHVDLTRRRLEQVVEAASPLCELLGIDAEPVVTSAEKSNGPNP